jgi:hypothetical protein
MTVTNNIYQKQIKYHVFNAVTNSELTELVKIEKFYVAEFLKFIGPRGQKIMRSANNVVNAGPHVRQTFLNDVFTFLTEVGNAGRHIFMIDTLPSCRNCKQNSK